MPALNVAVPFLFALFARGLSQALFVVAMAYAILIWIGSVLLGWHYAVDGYGGAFLAYMAYLASSYFRPGEENAEVRLRRLH